MILGLDETTQPRCVEGTARECVRYATTDDVVAGASARHTKGAPGGS